MRNNRKLLAIVVLYKPDKELLRANLNAFKKDVDHILLWENMTNEEALKYRIPLEDNMQYMGVGENIGISKALNRGYDYAKSHGFNYLMTMDQDSRWEGFSGFKKDWLDLSKRELCLLGPKTVGLENVPDNSISSVNWLITSGMIVPVELLQAIGGYNENFFVDSVDIELCLRAKSHGYKIYANTKSSLNQRFGTPNTIRILGKEIEVQYYSPFRLWGIFRGNVILFRIYSNARNIKELLVFMKVSLVSLLFVKKARCSRIKSICSGILSGLSFDKKTYYKYRQ